jgi:YggT family protein
MFLYNLLDNLCNVYVIIILIRAIMSWFIRDPYNPLFRFVISMTEPALAPIRRILPDMGGMDFSPILLILIIQYLIRGFLLKVLFFI